MTFAQPIWLWVLLLVPFWALWLWRRRRQGLRHGSLGALEGMTGGLWARLRGLPLMLRGAALVLLVLALARPQAHDVQSVQSTEGISIMLVLDISSSMRAQDFEPNRLEAAREVAAEFVESRPSDQIGLMVFAGQPYTQVPPTLDHTFLLEMIERIEVGMVEDGTAIGTALAASVNRLREADAESRVVVLLTDGENNRGAIDPYTAIGVAETMSVRVHTIGVSSFDENGDVQGAELAGGQEQNRPPGIDEEMLQAIAEETGGTFFRAGNAQGLRTVYQEISELEATEIEMDTYTETEERYGLFLWPALFVLLLALALESTRLRRFP